MKQNTYEKAQEALNRYKTEHRKDGIYLSHSSASEFAESYHSAINALFSDYQAAAANPEDLEARNELQHWYQILKQGAGPADHLIAFIAKLVEMDDSPESRLHLDSAKKVEVLLNDALSRNDAALSAELMLWLSAQTFAALERCYSGIAYEVGEITGVGQLARANRTGRKNKSSTALIAGLKALAREYGKVPTENELITLLHNHSTETTSYPTNEDLCPEIWMQEGRLYYEWADSPGKPTNTSSISLSTYRADIKKSIEL
jgi:hypothetical protein